MSNSLKILSKKLEVKVKDLNDTLESIQETTRTIIKETKDTKPSINVRDSAVLIMSLQDKIVSTLLGRIKGVTWAVASLIRLPAPENYGFYVEYLTIYSSLSPDNTTINLDDAVDTDRLIEIVDNLKIGY